MKTKKINILKRALVVTFSSLSFLICATVMYSSTYTVRDYSTWKIVSRRMTHSRAERDLKLMNSLEPWKYVLVEEWSGNAYIPWL